MADFISGEQRLLIHRVHRFVSFDFIYDILSPYYPVHARPSIAPVCMFSECTHRLCTCPGTLKTLLREPAVLTDEDVMELLIFVFQDETVQKKLDALLKERTKRITFDSVENSLF